MVSFIIFIIICYSFPGKRLSLILASLLLSTSLISELAVSQGVILEVIAIAIVLVSLLVSPAIDVALPSAHLAHSLFKLLLLLFPSILVALHWRIIFILIPLVLLVRHSSLRSLIVEVIGPPVIAVPILSVSASPPVIPDLAHSLP